MMLDINNFDISKIKSPEELGYNDYKKIKIRQIIGIHIENFRTIKDSTILLGKYLTLVSGKNGTMKSTLLGLIAHPFSSPNNAKDVFGESLKTTMKDVFFLSPDKDRNEYRYELIIETTDDNYLKLPIRVYYREKENRHRITVGLGNKTGQGNLSLNTAYINLRRLFPLVDTNAQKIEQPDTDLQKFIADGYMKILQKEYFKDSKLVGEGHNKETFSPSDDALCDFKSISSGEDNIGHILSKLYAFQKYKNNMDELQGILCIDELEAALHPVAQNCLFEYLLRWSENNKVQIVFNTHSLSLLQHAVAKQNLISNKELLYVNLISTAFVANNNYKVRFNPNYEELYKELTLEEEKTLEDLLKIYVLCEDDVAADFLKKILSKKSITSRIEIHSKMNSGNEGTSKSILLKLARDGEFLLKNSIIIFDADVTECDSLKNKNIAYLRLPSNTALPLEKEIVYWIHSLPADNSFFLKYNREKEAFIKDFASDYSITEFSLNEMKGANVKKFKKWAESDGNFKKYVKDYIIDNPKIMEDFRNKFLELLNKKLVQNSLPKIIIK